MVLHEGVPGLHVGHCLELRLRCYIRDWDHGRVPAGGQWHLRPQAVHDAGFATEYASTILNLRYHQLRAPAHRLHDGETEEPRAPRPAGRRGRRLGELRRRGRAAVPLLARVLLGPHVAGAEQLPGAVSAIGSVLRVCRQKDGGAMHVAARELAGARLLANRGLREPQRPGGRAAGAYVRDGVQPGVRAAAPLHEAVAHGALLHQSGPIQLDHHVARLSQQPHPVALAPAEDHKACGLHADHP
mmetsp:Transcript_10265/g.24539  ORF Transcript_10265/g.24539 Transcript_10265/m.24539 type:complete len:243 (+) Transcript_10265:676-1404(+)